jgi:hypothetical protein
MMGKELPVTLTGEGTMARKKTPPVDPELERQLASADKEHPVEAVFTLRPPDDTPLLEAGAVKEAVDRIVKSAQAASGQEVSDLHVLPMAQAFALAAPAGVVRAILESEEIASAMANAQPEDLAIKPVSRPKGKAPRRGGGKPRKGHP